jgi:hypothetical protein
MENNVMAKMQSKSNLAAKLGAKGAKAVKTHAQDETTYSGGGDLPGGIEGGIAQLVDCKFDQYKKGDMKGEYYFFAQASVVEPTDHEGIRVAGRYTSIMEPLCDTPTRKRATIDDHMAWILNEMRKLGADTSDAGLEDLEELAASIQEAAPYVRFRTWKGEATKQYPNPRVQHSWEGVAEDYDGEGTDDVAEDDDAPEDEDVETEEAEEEEEGGEDEVDLAALGEAGDNDDVDAQQQLQDLAIEAGIDHEEYGTWTELADALAEAEGGEEGEEEEEEAAEEEEEELDNVAPEKGEVCFYLIPKKPGQRGAAKKVEVEVTAVFASKETANIKDLSTGTLYKNVAWDKLLTE